ncbi:hypothetical protein E4U33_001153 [Claviceps sp. LM78 group G4]|nr:hypothetical protein E4U33_001153 [Claviceps sp. LM78 group G4]
MIELKDTVSDVIPEGDAIVSTVAEEPREVRSDEPRRTLVMKPEDVNAGHEGLEEDGEEKEGPETAEEGATSEPDEISVELEPKVDDASWVVDPTSEDFVPKDSVVDTPSDERSDDGDPDGRVSDDARLDGVESDWDINETGWYGVAAESDDKDTELDGPELHVDIIEGPGCVLAADPYDPGADEADATDSERVSEDTGPGELDATRLGEFTPDDADSDDDGTGDTEVDETLLGISEPEEDACTDSDVGDVELEESASVDCGLDGSGLVDAVSERTDETGAAEANVDDVSSAVGIDDAVSNGVETDEAALDTDRLDGSGFGSFDVRPPDDEGMGDLKLDLSPEDGELGAAGVELVTAAAVDFKRLWPDEPRLERESEEVAPDAPVPDKAVVNEIGPDELGPGEAGLETAQNDDSADGADPERTGPDEAGPDEAGVVEEISEELAVRDLSERLKDSDMAFVRISTEEAGRDPSDRLVTEVLDSYEDDPGTSLKIVSDELGLNETGTDEAGPQEFKPDVVWPDNVRLDDGRFVGVDISGSELTEIDEARSEDCRGTPEEVAGVAKTGRDDPEGKEAELRCPVAEDAKSDETAYEEGVAEEAVSDEAKFEEVPSTLDEVAAGMPRLSDSALALVDWSLCEVSATRAVPLDLDACTRVVCELES